MSDAATSDAAAAAAAAAAPCADSDAAKRQRTRVEGLLARAPVLATDQVRLHDGAALPYQVHATFVPVLAGGLGDCSGEPEAAVFTIAYQALAAGADGRPVPQPLRPVCFVFNGGPGASSIWLHLGALGPKRVPVHDDGSLAPAPYQVVDNPLTWLAHFDLVFIDPPQTGWSVSASDEARKKHLSVDGDVTALAEVVRGWLAAHRRFGAPLYLCGESYGTTRAAALTDQLLDAGLGLSGLILVSCAMDLQGLVFTARNDLPYALFLPAFAAAAQYHGTLKGPLGASAEAARTAAEAFVNDDYLAALAAGARLSGSARRRIDKRLAELTGLPLAVVQENNLRISDGQFFVEALRSRGLMLGRLDARATAPLAATRERQMAFDPPPKALRSSTPPPRWPITRRWACRWASATRSCRWPRTRPGTGNAPAWWAPAIRRASPPPATTWRAPCAAIRT